MKKVININFQGRVIPIEEIAFESLKQYIESLRRYFAKEEGREEIINDIQDRIGELFNDCLKKGATCITEEDLAVIINNMGRPEDFEAAEERTAQQAGQEYGGSTEKGDYASAQGAASGANQGGYVPRGRLYRNEADKVLGGVCSGIANYLKIDPVVLRILFVLIMFGSFGAIVLVYFVLWVALPAQGLAPNIRKRLYRNSDDRMIGGVCGGIASYFNIEVWVPRLIFAAPFLLGVIIAIFRVSWFNMFDVDDFHISLFNGFGGTMLVIYVILWAVLPEARTASEKLEMKGEKIDLESIKNTVQDELQSIKERAVKMGGEFSEKAQEWGQELKSTSRSFAKEASPVARRTGSGLVYAIGMIFKIFFMFIAGIIAFSLIMALIAVLFTSIGSYSISSIFLQGFWENFLVWTTLILFLGIPVLVVAHWIIRAIIGRKSQNNYLRYIFGTLWIVGLVSAICLAGLIAKDYRYKRLIITEIPITQPTHKRMIVKMEEGNSDIEPSWEFGVHLDGFMEEAGDSILLSNNIRLNVSMSHDSSYHVKLAKMSRGSNPNNALDNAQRIHYAVTQQDTVLLLAKGLILGQNEYFRNQGVVVNVQVPIGKHIILNESVGNILNAGVSFNMSGNDWNDNWINDSDWDTDVDYVMTVKGHLERADGKKTERNDDNNDEDDNNKPSATPPAQDSTPAGSEHNYRYKDHNEKPERKEKPEKPEAPSTPTVKNVSFSSEDADNLTSTFYNLIKRV